MSKISKHHELVLASSSQYRRVLLDMLMIPFRVVPPDIDELPRQGEDAATLVERLASEKAQIVGQQETSALIIGSDQVAIYAGQIIGLPMIALVSMLENEGIDPLMFKTTPRTCESECSI